MRVFLYEHITGGGTLDEGAAEGPSGCLLGEGTAMVQALVADFSGLPGVEVFALRDARLTGFSLDRCRWLTVRSVAEQRRAFDRLAGLCDATILIAPEISGILLGCCRRAVAAGATLISPGESAVELASDKLALVQRLASDGVPIPRTRAVSCGEALPRDFSYPAVLKPVLGAGSIDVHLIRSSADWSWPADSQHDSRWLLQEFCPGTPISVSFVCRPSGIHPMIPCGQRMTDDGRFRYVGGELPLPPRQAQRAIDLAEKAVACSLPGIVGYAGVDVVLGDSVDGKGDRVIEINPRLTTSYVGLRAAAQTNLAAAMLAAAEDLLPDMRFSLQPLQFDADGTVRQMVAFRSAKGRASAERLWK